MTIKNRKKVLLLSAVALIIIVGAIVAWNALAASTRVAFVNYQPITLGQISKANDKNFAKIEELPVEQLSKAGKYDMIFVNGMGLRITDEQRQALANAAEKGTPFAHDGDGVDGNACRKICMQSTPKRPPRQWLGKRERHWPTTP